MKKGTALITGASSGIGLELARQFARGGYDLVVVARREDKLRELASHLEKKVEVTVVPADLSQSDAPRRVWEALDGRAIDVLVNNAGFADYGPFAETDVQKQLDMIAVNITALTHLTRLFLPPMIERAQNHGRRGRILNVASTAAFLPGPLMAVYYATKAYVLSFSEALANELKGTNVSVTALCPGPTASEFQERAAMKRSRLMQGSFMDARTVALLGYRGMMRGQTIVVPGAWNRFLAFLPRVLPRERTVQIVRQAQDESGSNS